MLNDGINIEKIQRDKFVFFFINLQLLFTIYYLQFIKKQLENSLCIY